MPNGTPPPATTPPLTADDALTQERAALRIGPDQPTAALCLSGGGIRSAAFCLGVVQALARMGVLKQFHYLSTVSGGGYTGGYLSARLHTLGGNADKLQNELKDGGNASWLTRLRQSGNFLTPQLGLFSLDTWTGLTLYTRNLLLTWASLLPWVLLLALAFVAYRTLIAVAGREHWLAYAAFAVGAAGLALSTYWLCHGLPSHHHGGSAEPKRRWLTSPAPRMVAIVAMVWPVLVPFALGTWEVPAEPGAANAACAPPVESTTACSQPLERKAEFLRPIDTYVGLTLIVAYTACVLAGYAAAATRARGEVLRRYLANIGPWFLATLFSAVLTAAGPLLLFAYVPQKSWVEVLAVAGPAWFALAMIVHAGTFMGLRRKAPAATAELDREWTARMSARIQLLSVVAALIGFPILALPDWIIPEGNVAWTTGAWRGLLTPLLSGPAVAWLGHQAFTRLSALNQIDASWRDKAWDAGLALAAAVFLAFVLALASAVLQSYVLGPLQLGITRTLEALPPGAGILAFLGEAVSRIVAWKEVPACSVPPVRPAWCFQQEILRCCPVDPPAGCCKRPNVPVPVPVMLVAQAGAALLLVVAARILRIDNNRFTLHAVYRNRLVRGFLGPAREPQDRNPEPVTGFDSKDDIRLAALNGNSNAAGSRRLFPVVNIAVNVTSFPTATPSSPGSGLAQWAERKALSFTATPLHCGYFLPVPSGAKPRPTYIPTQHFNHSLRGEQSSAQELAGIGLGTAITISGAAASPNSGYHSRPATAFLMTLFNLRLGLWAPNTGIPRAQAGLTPAEQRLALLDDLRGNSSIERTAIYLSDGGHFDNLGLYEMLRRRCTFIVVVDAAHDPECSFADLGQSLRKAAIDFGATVSITASRIGPRKEGNDNKGLLGFALGEIDYPRAPGHEPAKGQLLYIKPTWLADLPMDVRAYGAQEPKFPQQPTSDQWFSESQFESYRSLGTHQLETLRHPQDLDLSLEVVFKRAKARISPGEPAPA